MNALGNLAFGTLSPSGLANVVAGCAGIFGRPTALGTLPLAPPSPGVVPLGPPPKDSSATTALLAVGVGAALLLVGLRFGASWYIGKQFGRGASGAFVGGIFGAPGLGILSLFPKD